MTWSLDTDLLPRALLTGLTGPEALRNARDYVSLAEGDRLLLDLSEARRALVSRLTGGPVVGCLAEGPSLEARARQDAGETVLCAVLDPFRGTLTPSVRDGREESLLMSGYAAVVRLWSEPPPAGEGSSSREVALLDGALV